MSDIGCGRGARDRQPSLDSSSIALHARFRQGWPGYSAAGASFASPVDPGAILAQHGPMNWKVLGAIVGGALALGAIHVTINVGWDRFFQGLKARFGAKGQQMVVGFLPVTCHLTCPVVDWTTRHSDSGALFESRRYSEFPTMCEDLTEGTLGAAFLNAPLAIAMVARGVPVQLVSLGHRDGSAIVVPAASEVKEFKDLRGKKILIPSKSSNQQLWLARL